MDNTVISILKNKTIFEILSELKLFFKFKFKFYNDLSSFKNEFQKNTEIIILHLTEENLEDYNYIINNNLPLIVISKNLHLKNIESADLVERLISPFTILDLKKKITLAIRALIPLLRTPDIAHKTIDLLGLKILSFYDRFANTKDKT